LNINAINITLLTPHQSHNCHKICDENCSQKRSERINRHCGKAPTINFETFEKTSIYSSIDLTCLF